MAETLSEDQLKRLIQAVLAAGPATEDDIERVVEWAHQARIDNTLVDLALEGRISLRWSDEKNTVEVKSREQRE